MRATIKDVARSAGVSPSTVSLVLNNRPASISGETRGRVLRAASELRYRPNQLAAGLVTKKTRTFGLIVPDIDAAKCTGCGTCLKRCRFKARSVANGKASVDTEKCMGCGLCSTGCPGKASFLVKRA